MSVVDLHPEELLDREARGDLEPDDRRRLMDHLERCTACQFERSLRADFAAELESDLSPALAQLAFVPTRVVRARAPRVRRGKMAWLLVAAVMLAVSAASASGLAPSWRVVVSSALRVVGMDVMAVPAKTAPQASQAERAIASAALPPPVREPGSTAANGSELLAGAAPSEPSPEPIAPSPPVASAVTNVPAVSAAVLFDEAAAARRRGDYAAAFAMHRDLETRYPRSREAHESRATMGRLLLDRGDAVAAVDSFDAYLSTDGGGLREEALAGRAEALDRLGRDAAARLAWEDLLEAFPLTPYADHAKARLSGASDP